MQTSLVQEQVYLQQGIVKQIQALVASEKPVVAFSATVNAPVRDTLDDGTANAGLRLTYNLNDGGSLEAKIARGKAELEVIRNEIAALKKSLDLEYHKNKLNYQTSEKRVVSLKEMIVLAEETQEVTRQQVVAGRSTIKDVLDGEVLLSSLRIDLINGQSESVLALVALEGFSTGLSKSLGWSY
jgi:outer membrane protein TolC